MTPQEFKQKRKALNITQKRLAFIMGVSILTIARYEKADGENSRKPHPTAAQMLRHIESGLLDIDSLVPSKR